MKVGEWDMMVNGIIKDENITFLYLHFLYLSSSYVPANEVEEYFDQEFRTLLFKI